MGVKGLIAWRDDRGWREQLGGSISLCNIQRTLGSRLRFVCLREGCLKEQGILQMICDIGGIVSI